MIEAIEDTSACGLMVGILHMVVRESRSGDLQKLQVSHVGV